MSAAAATAVSQPTVHLRASGVSLVLAVGDDRLPRVLHWGADLGELTDADLAALEIASQEPLINGELDERHRVAMIPEESWGWLQTPGLDGHRAGRDFSTRFTTTSVTLGDESGTQRLSVTAADDAAGLSISLTIEMLPSGLVRAKAELSSTGHGTSDALGGTPAPFTLDGLNLMFPVPREADELMDFSGRWIRERTPQRMPFSIGAHVRDARRGKGGHDYGFMTIAGEEGFGFRSGEVWATHVAWSGNSRMLAERNNAGVGLIGGGELPMAGEIQLAPGDTYEGPWIYASYGNGMDEMSARFHEWMRARPEHPSGPRPVIVNTWEAVYFNHTLRPLKDLADAAAAVGAERFVLDDGWFRHRRADDAGLGDWYIDEGVWPDGLGAIADYVRERGMEFGLWFEPEMINPDSDLARAHPEWIAQPNVLQQRLPLEARQQQVLDLTHPEAYAYIEERLHALVEEVEPGYLKWDHNRDLLEAGNTVTGRNIGRAQNLAYYRLLEGLLAAFPGLEIETCAGGGGRVDLEVLQRTQRIWASDCNDALERQNIQLYTSLLVPPEMMGTHIGPPSANTNGRTQGLDFRASTALWGHMGIEWNVASEEASTPEARAALTAWVALHKKHRALLHTGRVVRSDHPEPGRIMHGVVAQDGSEALYSYASVDSVHIAPTGQIRLEGLDLERRYAVTHVGPVTLWDKAMRAATEWWTNADAGTPVVLTGRVLGTLGIQAPAINPEEVLLIRVEAERED